MYKHLIQLFDMGGYGVYVWPCYALFLLILSWYVHAIFKRNAVIRNELKQNLWSDSNSDKQT